MTMKAYITGTDRGLGLALAAKFLEHGYCVFAGRYGIDPSGLDALKSQYGARLEIIPLDVGSDASVTAAAQLVASKTSSLDVLINNAAIIGQKDATITDVGEPVRLDFNDMLAVYNVNALGALRVAQSVLALLRVGEMKRIVNISSEAGSMAARVRRGQKTRYAYCASKAALNIQSILLQNHVAEYGIKVHLIEPGWLRTFLASKEKCTIAPTEPEESAERLVAFLRHTPPEYMFHDLFQDRPFDW
jgi:NAD(P)-dependent dehydrogenase (short-subunit alcohol dehydrogenase family)